MKDPGFLSRHGIKVNYPIAGETGIGVGGNADFFTEVDTVKTLAMVLAEAAENELQVAVIGWGSKVVFSDFGYRGLVIRNAVRAINIAPESVAVGGGAAVSDLINELSDEDYGGLEAWAGVPGSLGGALWAGAPAEATQPLKEVRIVAGGRLVTVPGKEFAVDRLRHGDVLADATFAVEPRSRAEIRQLILTATQRRLRTEPGAKHKVQLFREQGTPVAELAEGLGLAGERVGGAMISAKNPNFIITDGEAKAADVRELAGRVKYRIKLRRAVELEDNIAWLGEW